MISIKAVHSIFKMSSEELFCIASKDHTDQIKGLLKHLYVDKQFSDVTLVTDDQVVVPSHKFILSANSEVFKTILESPSNANKITFLDKSQKIQKIDNKTIFLRGINHNILEPVLKFCYMGLVDVDQEKVMEFFAAASDLKISEFTEFSQPPDPSGTTVSSSEMVFVAGGKENEDKQQEAREETNINDEDEIQVMKTVQEDILDMDAPANKEIIDQFIKNEDETKDLTREMKNIASRVREQRLEREEKKEIKREIMAELFPCSECDIVCSHLGNLKRHMKSKHEGIRYSCDYIGCDYKATQKPDIKRHKEFKHNGVRYECDRCNYKACTTGSLKLHVDAIHEGIKYPCKFCDHQSTTEGSLYLHIESKHKDLKRTMFKCEFCEFESHSKYILKNHKKKFHTYFTNQLEFK